MRTRTFSALVLAGAIALAGCASDGDDAGTGAEETAATAAETTEATEGEDAAASGEVAVSFGGVEDGATVTSPLTVSFEADGFEILSADEGGDGETSGHMHVMVDEGCVTPGEVIPSDETHIHFGDGSTTADLELEPGEHELCLQAGDGEHTALDVTDEITVTVE